MSVRRIAERLDPFDCMGTKGRRPKVDRNSMSVLRRVKFVTDMKLEEPTRCQYLHHDDEVI